MYLATTSSARTLQLFFCVLALASFSSPQASAKAFSPSHGKSHHAGLIHCDETEGSNHPRHHHVKAKRSWICMTKESGDNSNSIARELSMRGGDQAKPSIMGKKLIREMVAEMIGTFLIVQIGTASVMSGIFTDSLNLFSIASTWMICVTIAISTTADISGAHLNPAISIAFALLRPSAQFGWSKVLPYSIAQLVGAVLASGVNLAIYGTTIAAYEKANNIVRATASGLASAKAFGEYYVDPVTSGIAFLAEVLGTGVLSFVIFSLTNKKNSTAKDGYIPLLIGITVGALIATLAPLTQAGFNPARDFGPRIVAFLAGWKTVAFKGWWVYVFGPIVGAVAGATVADKVLHVDDDRDKVLDVVDVAV